MTPLEMLCYRGILQHRPGILVLLHAHPDVTPQHLRRCLKLSSARLTQLIDDLVERRLVVKQPVAGDKRRLSLCLSVAGHATARSIHVALKSAAQLSAAQTVGNTTTCEPDQTTQESVAN